MNINWGVLQLLLVACRLPQTTFHLDERPTHSVLLLSLLLPLYLLSKCLKPATNQQQQYG